MRFSESGPSIPNQLLEQSDAGRVVFFCGAGVSQYGINSEFHMPNFLELTKLVVEHFKPSKDSNIIKALRTWEKSTNYRPIPLDEIFFLLQNTFCKEEVNQVVTDILSSRNLGMAEPARHKHISQISKNLEGVSQVVTTNFDVLFERAIQDSNVMTHFPPYLPDLSQGTPITGITYLHGRIPEKTHHTTYGISRSSDLILSSADLGRAYLSEGWATDFVRQLVSKYTVVLIGYRADDPPIHYLLVGMGSGKTLKQQNLFAFDRGNSNTLESRWRAKGVTPIAYSDHESLWNTIELWANRSENIQKWRDKTIQIALQDPKTTKPFERGQVTYLMSKVDGFKKFSELTPVAHPEWINVFDKDIRLKRDHMWRDSREGSNVLESPYILDNDTSNNEFNYVETDPVELLKLDDYDNKDLGIPQDKFVKYQYLLDWICKNFDSATMLWWIANQSYISISTIGYLTRRLKENSGLSRKVRLIWNIVLEYQSQKLDRASNNLWQKFLQHVESDGWNESSIREFSKLTSPLITNLRISSRVLWSPYIENLEAIDLFDIIDVDVGFPNKFRDDIDIPDKFLIPALKALQENFTKASLMISEIDFLVEDGLRFTPTTYQDRLVFGDISRKEFTSEVIWFLDLFTRLAKADPISARSLINGLSVEDHYFSRKFKLFGLNFPSLFDIEEVHEFIMNLTPDQFWCSNNKRELLFLIVDRKDEFNQQERKLIIEKVLTIPTGVHNFVDDEEEEIRFSRYTSASYGLYLIKEGFKISQEATRRLNRISKEFGYLRSSEDFFMQETASSSEHAGTDYSIESLIGIPEKDVIDAAIEESQPPGGLFAFSWKDPFSGLVEKEPKIALNALIEKVKSGEYYILFWKRFLEKLPQDASHSIYKEVISHLAEVPEDFMLKVGSSLGMFIKERFDNMVEADKDLTWKLIDKYLLFWVNCSDEYDEKEEVIRKAEKVRSLHGGTYRNVTKKPIGLITECLSIRIEEDMKSLPDNVKLRIERLMTSPSEARSYCISVLAHKIGLLYRVDPDWTQSQLFPHFEFDRDTSEAAWSGLIASEDYIDNKIISSLMHLIVSLFPWVNQFSWTQRDINVCANLVIEMGVTYSMDFHYYYNERIRDCIRGMSEEARLESISSLHHYILRGEVSDTAISFIGNVWPKESYLHTEKLTSQWINLLVDSDEDFPAVYSMVKNFLVPLKYSEPALNIFFKNYENGDSLADKFPSQILDILNRVVLYEADCLYIDIPEMLMKISARHQSEVNNPHYLRLLDLAEKTPFRLNASFTQND